MYELSLDQAFWIKKYIFYYNINKDAFLAKGVSNEETASRDQRLHPCETDSENTSLLVNDSNISNYFPRTHSW